MRSPRLVLAFVLSIPVELLGCAGPSATAGLLEGELPVDTLAREGDLGFDGVNFATKQVLLASGLRFVIEQTATRGMAGVVITVGAGSTSDPPGKEGLAHFAEHLAFRGRIADGPTLGQRLDRAGASYNAITTLDSTKYFFFAPRAQLPLLIAVANELLERPLGNVDPAGASIEHEIVLNELRQRNETRIYGQVLGWLQEALFPAGHPYARPIGGSLQSLGPLRLADARTFAAEHYRPDNATLLVIGELAPEEALELLDRLPKTLVGDPKNAREPSKPVFGPAPSQPPAAPKQGHTVHTAPVSRPEAWIAWSLPSPYSSSGAQVKMVTAPVVQERLRKAFASNPEVAEVSVIALPSRQITILACQLVFHDAKKRAELTKEALELLTSMWQPLSAAAVKEVAGALSGEVLTVAFGETFRLRYQVTEQTVKLLRREMLQGMQQEALAEVVFGAEAFSGRALDRADFLHVLGNHGTYVQMLRTAAQLHTDAVSAFAGRQLTPARARILYIDPPPSQDRPAPGVVGVSPIDRQAEAEVGRASDFGEPPAVPALPELSAARTFRLENGLQVALIPRRQFPVITAALAFHGGRAAGEPTGVVELLRYMEPSGSVSIPLSAMQVKTYDGGDYTADVVRTGRRNLGQALRLLAVRLVQTDQIEWDKLLGQDKGGDKGGDKASPSQTVTQAADRALASALYGDHPYGRLPTVDQLMRISPEQMKEWTLRMRHPRNATLVVVGDLDPAAAEKTVRGWYGRWKGHGPGGALSVPHAPLPARSTGEKVIVNHRGGVSQTHLTIACRLPPFDARGVSVYQVLASLVASDLLTRVREDAGAAYSVSGESVVHRGGAAHLQFSLDVDDRRLRQVMGVVRARWARLAAGDIDPGALSQVKWNLSTETSLQFQTSTELALRALETLNLDLPLESVDRIGRDLPGVSPAELAGPFRICAASTVFSLIGDTEKIRQAL